MAMSADLGFAVREVYAAGRLRTDPEALRAGLGISIGQPILAIDPIATRERLEKLPWVERASVERLLPDRVQVRLIERQPLALWQRDGRFALIDRGGQVIAPDVTTLHGMSETAALADPEADPAIRWGQLRVLVGEAAPQHAARLFALLSTEPELWARVAAATWVGDRRWTLRLDNRIDVLMPEQNMLRAWRLLAQKAREDAAARARDLGHRPALPAGPPAAPARSAGPAGQQGMKPDNVVALDRLAPRTGRPARADRRARHRHDQDVLPDRAAARRRLRAARRQPSARRGAARRRDRRRRGGRGVDRGGGARGRAAGRPDPARGRARRRRRPAALAARPDRDRDRPSPGDRGRPARAR